MMLDVFKSDAFHYTKLTAAINRIPYVPTRLAAKRVFEEAGVPTLTVAIELQDGRLTLVPNAARGSGGPAKNLERRKIIDLRGTHLPQRVAVMADEVIGLRAFGTEQDTVTAMALLNQKAAVATRDLDLTHEWHRAGALQGKVLDADGTTVLYDLYAIFGVAQTKFSFDLDNDNTDVREKCVQYLRLVENKLGGVMMSGMDLECSEEFMDALVGHPQVKETFKYREGEMLRRDVRDGFNFGGINFAEYRGSVNGTRFVPANLALPVPRGVPDLFKTWFMPAPYMDAVGQPGLPRYMKPRIMDYDVGIEYEVQSNPLHICTRPEALVVAGATNASIA
jgi:hypothetical protein